MEGVEVKMWVNISGKGGAKVCTDARNTLNTFAFVDPGAVSPTPPTLTGVVEVSDGGCAERPGIAFLAKRGGQCAEPAPTSRGEAEAAGCSRKPSSPPQPWWKIATPVRT